MPPQVKQPYVPVISTINSDNSNNSMFKEDTSYQLPKQSSIQYDKIETSIMSSDTAKKVKFKTVNFNGAGQGKLNVAAAFQEDNFLDDHLDFFFLLMLVFLGGVIILIIYINTLIINEKIFLINFLLIFWFFIFCF